MIDRLTAEYHIRQLHARFADAVWRNDADDFADCFSEDAEWKIATRRICGRDDIRVNIAEFLAPYERVHLITGMPLLEIDSGKAIGRCPVTELSRLCDGSSVLTLGIYHDRYIAEGDRWRFKWRHFALHYRGPIDMSVAFVDCPDYGPFPVMPAEDAPTFTRRKAVE